LTEYVYNDFPWSQNTYLLDQGLVPDFILRRAIRLLLRQRLREIDAGSFEANHAAKMKWIEEVRARRTIADVPEKANEQHYEVRTFIYLEGHSDTYLPRVSFSWFVHICEVTAVVDGIPSVSMVFTSSVPLLTFINYRFRQNSSYQLLARMENILRVYIRLVVRPLQRLNASFSKAIAKRRIYETG